jgi:hypothetical protein
MTLIFLLRYPEPHNVLTNPRWYPYAMGSPREGQAQSTSHSVESCGPSPRASRALLLTPLGRSPPSPQLSFRPKCRVPCLPPVHCGDHDTNSVVTVSQDSRPTQYNITTARTRDEGFSELTPLTRIHLEQVYKRSN